MSCLGVCRVAGRTLDGVALDAPDDPRRAVRAVLCWESERDRRKHPGMERVILVPPVWCLAVVCAANRAWVLVIEVELEWRLHSLSTLAR